MRLEYENPAKIKKMIKQAIGMHLDLSKYKIFVFGSRVTGKGNDRSDIDIGVLGSRALSLSKLGAIKEAMEDLPILYKVDVVDFKRAGENFKKVALTKIEHIK